LRSLIIIREEGVDSSLSSVRPQTHPSHSAVILRASKKGVAKKPQIQGTLVQEAVRRSKARRKLSKDHPLKKELLIISIVECPKLLAKSSALSPPL
jgi:hypothetical protein